MNLMLPDSGLLFWMTVIFLIVLAILAKFGFPVITGMVDRRTKRIDDAIRNADEAEAKLTRLVGEQERIMEDTRRERAMLMQDAAAERDRMIALAREQAQKEAEGIIAEARERIREEKEAALRDMRREVAELSLAISEKVMIKELADDEEQKKLMDRLVEEIGK